MTNRVSSLSNWNTPATLDFAYPYNEYTPVGNGVNILYLYANDTAGNEIYAIYNFTIDDIDPSIFEMNFANNSVYNSNRFLNFTITDNTQLNSVQYQWDSSGWTEFLSPYDTFTLAGAGPHTLYLSVEDAAGNIQELYFECR